MKVVLREEIEHLGEPGQVVSVAAGYARNYLLPKGLALVATPGNLKTLEHQRRSFALKGEREVGEAQTVASRLSTIELTVTKKAGESGTLYGSVTNSEIAELLAARGIEIDRRRIAVETPIKTLGSYDVPIKLHRKVGVRIKLHVVGEPSPE